MYVLLSELLHDADMKLFTSMLHCVHPLLPPSKFMSIKLCTFHWAFVLPYCHYNLYRNWYVLPSSTMHIWWGILIACDVAFASTRCFMYISSVLKLHTFSLSVLYFCNSYYVSFSVLLDGVWLSVNKRTTYLLTYLSPRSLVHIGKVTGCGCVDVIHD